MAEYSPRFQRIIVKYFPIFRKARPSFFRVLSPGQTIATCQRNISQHCWAQHVALVWPPCCDMLGVVGSNLKREPTTPNMSQRIATRWPNAPNMLRQQCCDMLRWHVVIVWPGLYSFFYPRLFFFYPRLFFICDYIFFICDFFFTRDFFFSRDFFSPLSATLSCRVC